MVTQRLLTSAGRFSHLSVPLAAVVILLVLLVPLPAFALDVLISFNLMLSVVVMLSSIYILQPVKFTSFPNLLLLTTLFRLSALPRSGLSIKPRVERGFASENPGYAIRLIEAS